jgi:hypothetical protein
MTFLKAFLRNLALLAGLGLIIYLIEPEMVTQVIEAYWLIFGPIAIFMVIVFAIPRTKGKKR